ncbi:MAG TPA: hypothetical protein VJR92_14110 [Gemmatimonadaceae bacterium]|nr:hypothetical protein [Gemmatimonadaceae bacterium]
MNTRTTARLCAALALTANGALAQTPLRRLALTEDLKIDGATEDISGIGGGLWIGGDGRVAIMNGPAGHFVFFDRAGKRMGTFGAKGEGPGEFTPTVGNIYGMRVGSIADSMWVENNRRYTIIGPDGKLARTMLQPSRDASMISFIPTALLPGNRILGTAKFGTGDRVELQYRPDTIVVIASNGAIERRIGGIAPDSASVMIRLPSRATRSIRVPFVQRPQSFVSPNGMFVGTLSATPQSANGGTFRLTVYRTSGEQVFSRSYPYASEPVTKRLADSAMARLATIYRSPEDAAVLRVVRDRIPASMSPFESMALGDDGTVWLSRESNGKPGEMLLISAAGDVVGSAVFPRAHIDLREATRNTIWAVETDADGFLSIVRFRVGQ